MQNIHLNGQRRGALPSFPKNDSDDDHDLLVARSRLVEGEDGGGRVFLTRNGRLVRVASDEEARNCREVWDVTLNHVVEETDARGTWFSVVVVDTELVCLSRSGAIVTVDVATGEATLVGEFAHGIFQACWSPDREVLALVTLAEPDDERNSPSSAILFMTTDFQVLAEVPLEQHDVKEAVHLVWRPDGTLMGVSSVDQADQQRKIRIYRSNPFELSAIGRTEDGSGKLITGIQSTPLAWAGPGCSQLMASIVPKGRKDLQVAFLEKNGLRHGQYLLRLTDPTQTTVQNIAWNSASDILMLHLSEPDYDTVQLWTRCNYHWYLKWNRRFPEKCSLVTFDEENPYLLDVLLQNREWEEYTFKWDASNVDCFGTAVVVDGRELFVTPFEKALVPPPMAAAKLQLASPVLDVIADQAHSLQGDTLIVVVLCDGNLVIVAGKDEMAPSLIGSYVPPLLKAVVKLPDEARHWRSYCIVNVPSSSKVELICVEAGLRCGAEKLVHFEVSWSGDDQQSSDATIDLTRSIPLESPLLAMTPWCDTPSGALLASICGDLLEYDLDEGALVPLTESGSLLEPCPWLAALRDPAKLVEGDCHKSRLVIGKTERGRLFCHDLLLSDSISSFILDQRHGFLCFATAESRCELRFIPLASLIEFDPLGGLDETLPLLRGYEPRHVERGARLVATLEKPSVVLQMPRGNLEGIYPRALVLQHCMQLIRENQYALSFALMRRQKVDTNLIVDMNPVSFLSEGAMQLVEQIESIEYLNLFISTLQNWDSTSQRYPIPEWLSQRLQGKLTDSNGFDFSSKVNRVCQRLRTIMIDAENNGSTKGGRTVKQGQFLLPVLSTFAKENPPQLEQALSLIQENAVSSTGNSSSKPPLFSDSAQHSIHYLAFLAEYELLFNTALGMYDYDIARAVARNSQMDPKVYLPLLKKFREVPKFYGRYLVDLRLKRYDRALQNLFESCESGEDVSDLTEGDPKGNGFDACFHLIKTHMLHDVGLKLFKNNPEQHHILLDLGDTLLASNKSDEALGVFLLADPIDHDRVMQAARSCRNWRIYFAHALPIGKESGTVVDEIELSKRQLLARDIATDIESSFLAGPEKRRASAEAARVLLDYGQDVNEAVETLLRGQWWDEAVRIVAMHSRHDLRRKCTDAAVSYAIKSMEDWREKSKTFEESTQRYVEVLHIRKDAYASGEVDALGFVEGKEEDETGSMFSAASQASNLSSMSRGSTGSTGSVGSISTVISVKSTTSFTLTGTDDMYRHKSKYNQIGRNAKKKQKKKKNKGRTKILPGSERELKDIVETLRLCIPDENYVEVLSDTILFLCRERQLETARSLYAAMMEVSECIEKCQKDRQEQEAVRVKELARENPGKEVINHPSEKIVNSWKFVQLPYKVHQLIKHMEFI